MGKIPDSRWPPRGRAVSRRRSLAPPNRPVKASSSSRSTSRVSKPDKKSSSTTVRRRPSMDIVEGISRWLPYMPIGRRISGTRLIAFKVPLKNSYVRRLDERDQFTVGRLLDSVPELGLVIDLTQTDRYYNKQEFLERGVHYAKIPSPGQQIPPENLVLRFFSTVDYYLDHHPQDNTVVGVHCTHGVNRTGYMLARYLVQRLGIPVREAVMSITNARNHEIERKQYISELERHTNLIAKESSSKDIQFSRMRPDRVSGMHTGIIGPPVGPMIGGDARGGNVNWREEKMKLTRSHGMRRSESPGKFNDQICDPRSKEQERDIRGVKYGPPPVGFHTDRFKNPIDKYIDGYREFWDKEPPAGRSSRSRDRDMRSVYSSRGEGRSRTREERSGGDLGDSRHHHPSLPVHRHSPPPPSRGASTTGTMPPTPHDNYMREEAVIVYDERYRERHRASPPTGFDNRSIIEEGRRNYRENKPHIPIEENIGQPRGFPDNYIKPSISRERPAMIDGIPPYEHHPGRMDRFREYESRLREDIRPPSPHFRERFGGNIPPYGRGEVEPPAMPYMPDPRIDEPNSRELEVDLPIGGTRLESNMPVGGRRMNECLPENPTQRIHMEEVHMVRGGRMDDVPLGRGHRNEEIHMMRDSPMNRPINREFDEYRDRDRRDLRRSPSRPRSSFIESFGPRGGEIPPPYEIGSSHMAGNRYDGSPIRSTDGEPSRRRTSSPRQSWHEAQRNPPLDYPRMNCPDVPPQYRDYPPFRGNDGSPASPPPPQPGMLVHEGDMRRGGHEERGRKGRSPSKDREHRTGHEGRDSRNRIRRNISPNKFRHSKQREEHLVRGGVGDYLSPPPDERGRRHQEENWPRRSITPPSRGGPSGQPGREVWVNEHHPPPPVRSRIDDGPDCRLIINKKRSTSFPEDERDLPPVRQPRTDRSRDRDDRRRMSQSPMPHQPSLNENERSISDSIRHRGSPNPMKDLRRLKSDKPPLTLESIDKPRGSPFRRRGGPSRSGQDRIGHRGGPSRPRSGSKKPVFDRLDGRRGRSGHRWPR